MNENELRSADETRTYLLQGICLQLARVPTAAMARSTLDWAIELTSEGHPLPPLGFVADVGQVALGMDRESHTGESAAKLLPSAIVRGYEDYVLGKRFADPGFARAADAIRQMTGRNRNRGLAYLVHRISAHLEIDGMLLGPSGVKALADHSPAEILTQGWASLNQDGLNPVIAQLYESLTAKFRVSAELLEPEDIFELEHGTALTDLAERVALRQVVRVAARLNANLPLAPPIPIKRHQEASTLFFDEDAYPVGGFSSITNRGSIESLLHSQLAYMETDPAADKPDLFDIKFVRDELLHYSRDENDFLRRRRAFVFVMGSDLIAARFKDPELPFQRLIMALGFVTSAVQKLQSWLSTESLRIDLLWPASTLIEEERVSRIFLREPIKRGVVQIRAVNEKEIGPHIESVARRWNTRVLTIHAAINPHDESQDYLRIHAARPELSQAMIHDGDDAFDAWTYALSELLSRWM